MQANNWMNGINEIQMNAQSTKPVYVLVLEYNSMYMYE